MVRLELLVRAMWVTPISDFVASQYASTAPLRRERNERAVPTTLQSFGRRFRHQLHALLGKEAERRRELFTDSSTGVRRPAPSHGPGDGCDAVEGCARVWRCIPYRYVAVARSPARTGPSRRTSSGTGAAGLRRCTPGGAPLVHRPAAQRRAHHCDHARLRRAVHVDAARVLPWRVHPSRVSLQSGAISARP